jgi:Spy/CpxP family protein refolding chaperone
MNVTRAALWRVILLLAVIAVLLPHPAAGQRFRWWQAEHVQRELSLTQEQSSRLEEIFQSYLPTLREQQQTLDEAEAVFSRLLARADFDAAIAQVEVVGAARAALNKSRTLQLLHMRRVLTADQSVRLSRMLNGNRRDGGRGRVR